MKFEGFLSQIPVYSTPSVPSGVMYLLNRDTMFINYPKRKDGKPDMRFGINRLMRLFGYETHLF